MNKTFVRTALGAWLLGSAAAVVAMVEAPVPAMAAEKAPPGPTVQKAVGVALQAAIAAVQAKDYPTAEAKIAEAKAVSALTDVDQIKIDIVIAYLAVSKGDQPAGLAAYKRIIASPVFTIAQTPDEQSATLKNTMILGNLAKDWPTSIAAGEKLAASGIMDDAGASNLSIAYYYNKDYAKAAALANKSVAASIAAGKKPELGVLQIVKNSYINAKDMTNARKTLDQIILYYGDADTWAEAVGSTISNTPGIKDTQVMQLYRLAILAGASIEASDYAAVGDQLIKSGYPGEARSALQIANSRGIRSAQLDGLLATARAKASADEKTLAGNDAAGAKSANGILDTVVALQYYGYGRYAEAATVAQRAIGKGGAKDPQEPKMVLGMALAADGKYADAVQAFGQVGGSEAQKAAAHLWTVYAQSKMQPTTPAAH